MTSGLTRREFLTAASGAVAAGALAQGASAQSGGSWLSLGNDPANTGLTDGAGPTGDVGRAWATGTDGAVFGGPAVVDDLVIAGSEDSVVYGIDAGSGDIRWTFEAEGVVDTTPAIADDTVYVGDREGFLYALDIAGGDDQEQWRFETQGEVNSPAVFDGTVYVSSRNGALHAVDAEEGRSVDPDAWPVSIGRGASGVESSPAVATAEESGRGEPTIVVGSGDGRVYAVNSDGSAAWTTTVDNAQSIPTAPAVADGTVYVGSLAGGQSGYLHALDGVSGDQLWEFDAGGPVYGSPAIADGTAFVGSRAGTLFAVDSSSGTEEWEYDTGRQIRSAPAVTDDAVYFASLSSEVVGVDRASGDELWTFETNQQVTSHPAVTDGAVFIGGQDTYVYRLETGAEGTAPDPTPENTGPVPGPLERDRPGDFTFLALPAAAGGFLALVAGGAYAAKRAGVLQRFGVDEAPIEEIYEDDEHIPDYDAPPSTDVWELVVGDVIARAEETDKVATKNLIVSRYLDADTLDSPVVAYEIESARSDTAGVRIEEQLIDPEETADEMAEQPLNEGWSVSDESLVYERAIEAGETVKTMVGRVDCPTERADELRTSPEIEIGTDDE